MLHSIYFKCFLAGWFFCLSWGGFSGTGYGEDQEPVAYQVKVLFENGNEYDAVIMDKGLITYFKDHSSLDLTKLDPEGQLVLYYMMGMSGSMGVRVKDLKTVNRLLPLDSKELKEMVGAIGQRIDDLREKEKVRLKEKAVKFAAAKKKAAEAAKERKKAEHERALARAEKDRVKWVMRFPPDQGWGPEKKEELYRRSMVVGVFPNEEEKLFLDHFNEWMRQYEVWKVMEEQRAIEMEGAKKEPDKVPPAPEEEKKKSAEGKKSS